MIKIEFSMSIEELRLLMEATDYGAEYTNTEHQRIKYEDLHDKFVKLYRLCICDLSKLDIKISAAEDIGGD